MTYWALNLPFLTVALVVAVAAVVARRSPRWRWVGLTAAAVLLLTTIFDNVLVGVGIVGYDPALISGVLIGVAPVEDFAYAIAAVVLLPSLWHVLSFETRRASRGAQEPRTRRASRGAPQEPGTRRASRRAPQEPEDT